MHEFSLDPKLVKHIKSSSTSRQNNDEYVVCRIRKNYDRKRKADDRDHDREEATRVVQSKRNKIQRLSENIDESYVAPMSSEVNVDHYNQQQQQQQQTNINATSTSSSIAVTNVDQPQYSYHEPAQYYEVINQYDIPLQQEQTTTTIDHANVTNLPTGLTEQQRYFVTQDRTVASSSLAMPDNQQQQMHLPQYYHDTQEPMTPMTAMARPYDFIAEAACLSQPNSIADPTMASSLCMARQKDYLQHNGFVNNTSTDTPQYYYSSTQDPSSGTDSSQYDPPQTGTTGFADQAHYFVADPTTASSPTSPSNLDQKSTIRIKIHFLTLTTPNFMIVMVMTS
ncbi:hypothetical protein DVH24_004155 [Malus domestica]|uniref:Uncharacterized protein n=1 Tax=Malus domestica TaxID=3750 RepID=A0A498KDB0_MALDO|nr:hypothetical protein DVH24_004155 [Malus domestica]